MVGEEITLIRVYGDITRLPTGGARDGRVNLIPISRAYKRVAQGAPQNPIHQTVRIGNIEVGGDDNDHCQSLFRRVKRRSWRRPIYQAQ
jgi:hypothetical protein